MDKNQLGMDRLLQDLWWRQRNIVFPDTVRNEGVFYRALGGRSQSRNSLQRVGIMMLAVCFLFGGCFFLAVAIGILIAEGLSALVLTIINLGVAIVAAAIGGKLAMAAVFPSRPPVHAQIIHRRRISGRK